MHRTMKSPPEPDVAAVQQAEAVIADFLEGAIAGCPTFVDAVQGMLDEAIRISVTKPTLVEIFDARGSRYQAFVTGLINVAVARGELRSSDRLIAADTLTAILVGLWRVNVLAPWSQQGAVDGLKKLVAGDLLQTLSDSRCR